MINNSKKGLVVQVGRAKIRDNNKASSVDLSFSQILDPLCIARMLAFLKGLFPFHPKACNAQRRDDEELASPVDPLSEGRP